MVGDEPELPYERRLLSKDYLAGEKTFERLLIRPRAFWDERKIEMRLGERVVEVRPRACTSLTVRVRRSRTASSPSRGSIISREPPSHCNKGEQSPTSPISTARRRR